MKHFLSSALLILSLLVSGYSFAQQTDIDATDNEYPTAYVTQAYVELHTGPGRGYPVFYIAERGEAILLLKQRRRNIIRIDNDN